MESMSFLFFLFFFSPVFQGQSVDQQFRMKNGHCQNGSSRGFNSLFFGECGNLSYKSFSNRKYKNHNFKGSLWISTFIKNFKIKGGDLRFTSMDRALLLQSSFEDVKADFIGARGSRIQSVIWKKASLTNFLAQASRIRKTQFIDCDLRKADFWGSSLQETSFQGSDLRDANLQGTHLLFTNFKGARFNNKTRLPFSEKEALLRGMVKVD